MSAPRLPGWHLVSVVSQNILDTQKVLCGDDCKGGMRRRREGASSDLRLGKQFLDYNSVVQRKLSSDLKALGEGLERRTSS